MYRNINSESTLQEFLAERKEVSRERQTLPHDLFWCLACKFSWALWQRRKIGFHFFGYSYHPRRTSWYSGGLVWFPKNFTRTAKVAYLYFPLCCQEKVACAQVAMIISVSPTNQLYSFCVNDSKWNGGACFIRQRWSSIPLTEGSEDRWGLWRYPLTFSVFRRRKSCWEACC